MTNSNSTPFHVSAPTIRLREEDVSFGFMVETAITPPYAEALCKMAGCEHPFHFGGAVPDGWDVPNLSVFQVITEIYDTLYSLEMDHEAQAPEDREPFLRAIRLFKALL